MLSFEILKTLSNKMAVGHHTVTYYGNHERYGFVVIKKITVTTGTWAQAVERELYANMTISGTCIAFDFEDQTITPSIKKRAERLNVPPMHRTYTVVVKYIPGKDLAGVLELQPELPFETLLAVFLKMATALQSFHTKYKMVHRDVKPDNFILEKEGDVRLIDFGVSTPRSDNDSHLFSGSPHFAPPEAPQYSEKGDVFSLALSMLWLLGIFKPEGYTRGNISFDFQHQIPTKLQKKWGVSEDRATVFSHLLNAMLETHVETRMPLDEVVSGLNQIGSNSMDLTPWASALLEGQEYIQYDEKSKLPPLTFEPKKTDDLKLTGYDIRTGQSVKKKKLDCSASSRHPAPKPLNPLERFSRSFTGLFSSKKKAHNNQEKDKRPEISLLAAPEGGKSAEGSPNGSFRLFRDASSLESSPNTSLLVLHSALGEHLSGNPGRYEEEKESLGEKLTKTQAAIKGLEPQFQASDDELIRQMYGHLSEFIELLAQLHEKISKVLAQDKKTAIQLQLMRLLNQFLEYTDTFKNETIVCSHLRGNCIKYIQSILTELSDMGLEAEPLRCLLTQLTNCIILLGTSNPDSIRTHSPDLSGCSGNTSKRGSLFDPLPTLAASAQQLSTIQASCQSILQPPHYDPNNNRYN